MKRILILIILLFSSTNIFSQYRFHTVRDTTKYNENRVDIKVFRAFNNIQSKFVNSFVNITNESIVPVIISVPVGLYIGSRLDNNHYGENSAVLLALSEITTGAATQLLKIIVKRPRPFRVLNYVYLTDTNSIAGSYSFPSGHSSSSFAIATSLTLRYPDNPVLIAGCYTYATLVALGRIYWGVHYPSDVLAGMLIGTGSAALIYSLRAPIIEGKNNLFNQSEWTDTDKAIINTPVFLLSLITTDLLNFYFTQSKNEILRNSKLNFSSVSNLNYLNYSLSF